MWQMVSVVLGTLQKKANRKQEEPSKHACASVSTHPHLNELSPSQPLASILGSAFKYRLHSFHQNHDLFVLRYGCPNAKTDWHLHHKPKQISISSLSFTNHQKSHFSLSPSELTLCVKLSNLISAAPEVFIAISGSFIKVYVALCTLQLCFFN